MRLQDRYFLAEQVVPFLLGVSLFVLMLVGNTLFALLDQLMRQKWPVLVVARLLLYNLPIVLQFALPIASALSASLAVNRLARDGEITALRTSGARLLRLFAPMAFVGALAGIACGYISERVVPWAWREQQNVYQLLTNLPVSPVENALTIQVENYTITWQSQQSSGPGRFRLNDVTLLDRGVGPDMPPRVSTAKSAEYAYGSGVWTLKDVAIHEFEPDGTTRFDAHAATEELSLTVDFNRAAAALSGEQLTNLSFVELSKAAASARATRDPRAVEFEANRWHKLSLPLLCLPLALLSAPLALRFSRFGPVAGVVISLALVFLGVVCLFGAKAVALSGKLPPPLIAFGPSTLFLVLALFLIQKAERP